MDQQPVEIEAENFNARLEQRARERQQAGQQQQAQGQQRAPGRLDSAPQWWQDQQVQRQQQRDRR